MGAFSANIFPYCKLFENNEITQDKSDFKLKSCSISNSRYFTNSPVVFRKQSLSSITMFSGREFLTVI